MSDRLPPLPSLRALTAELRALNSAYSHPAGGPEYVHLICVAPFFPDPGGWCVACDPSGYLVTYATEHRELVPGDCFPDGLDAQLARDAEGAGDLSKWDATAAARRLLAAARDA